MASQRLVLALLPLALAACASTGSRHKADGGPKLVVQPAQTVNTSPPLHKPKTSPYAPAQEDLSKRGDYVAGGLFRPGEADTVPDDIPDVDAIPEPEVRNEPLARTGNKSYSVLGKRYTVLDTAANYLEEGGASYYGKKFHGRRTSSGEVYDMYAFTAAHKTLPLPSYARVTNLDNGKSVVVKINDRGPFHSSRIIDLSYAAAVKLGYREKGTARVEVRALHPGDADTTLAVKPRPADATAMDRLVDKLPEALAAAGPVQPSPVPAKQAADTRYRFDMHQNGKVMSADEFDAWMQSRRVRVATGKPGKPDLLVDAAMVDAADRGKASPQQLADATRARFPEPAAAPPPSPVTAAALVAATTPAAAERVTLQVASFSNPQNAQHALAMLQGASIGGARLLDADVNGQKIWRLRIGPVDATTAPELAARVVGLGFGQPQRVRE
ncbi:septal ring lytic transglycosylase RlpA family protein [Thermomonas sp. HDW16]|uniref:septal ring lytic transglycosylase RlpA family protein n=1 Tax=Thermomonas sp. HDW16 TaxID=2714945 RepID=UPI00140DF878|nr:septal ring lytic transglycosylase RlpA family protein [Thermomonas sp. HDW16]QIL19252.1 septal ring lytic transglycosylase RlpA family protein [Thermomonas sp. HDW16]